jgi:small conductance mechanosensitive channel
VDAGGVNGGTVREIGLFTTALDTADNVRVSVGNNKIFADSIRNYSTNPTRRVDLTAHLVHGIDPIEAMNRVSEQMSSLANVLKQPSPSVDILGFTPTGTVLGVRAYCRNEHVGQVQADANRLIGEVVTNAWEALRLPGDQVRTPQWSDRAH